MEDAFEVSLDYLVGASEKQLNKEMVKRIEDVDKMKPDDKKMIYAIKNILDYALKKEQESLEVPEAHQKLVMERFDKVHKDPDRLLDWDEAKKTLKA